ncbi:MAG: orotidine 5'-phosphate decarboxylase [Candidatus Bathyarchaeia archaeon]
MSFNEKIRKTAEANRSRTVLALDLEERDPKQLAMKSEKLLQKVGKHICAVKINRQLAMSLGMRGGIDRVVDLAHDLALPAIMDAKLNDVGHTNEFMARSFFDIGFDAIIASPVAGWENGLDTVFAQANSRGRAVILLVYMSNPGAEAFYSMLVVQGREAPKPVFELLAGMAIQWKAQGVVVGATKPDIISRVRELVGPGMGIYSPGVGAQGGDPRKALDAGSTYLIVGRAIYGAPEPEKAAMEFQGLVS